MLYSHIVGHLHILFEIHNRRCVHSPHLCIYMIIYLYQHGLRDLLYFGLCFNATLLILLLTHILALYIFWSFFTWLQCIFDTSPYL